MKKQDLPQRWKEKIECYTDEKYGNDYKHRGELSVCDFPYNSKVIIHFPDGSKASFSYAFFMKAPEWQEVAVFTEHCGYHIFPLADLQIDLVEGQREPSDNGS